MLPNSTPSQPVASPFVPRVTTLSPILPHYRAGYTHSNPSTPVIGHFVPTHPQSPPKSRCRRYRLGAVASQRLKPNGPPRPRTPPPTSEIPQFRPANHPITPEGPRNAPPTTPRLPTCHPLGPLQPVAHPAIPTPARLGPFQPQVRPHFHGCPPPSPSSPISSRHNPTSPMSGLRLPASRGTRPRCASHFISAARSA